MERNYIIIDANIESHLRASTLPSAIRLEHRLSGAEPSKELTRSSLLILSRIYTEINSERLGEDNFKSWRV